ncbi:MAG: HK97 family phage prohead protease, partial [Candidatus Saccharimonadales bacterium]
MANIDFSAWNASKAWAAGAKSDDPAAFYNGICAGKKAGDPKTQEAHALPYRYTPSSPPNAAGVRNALARLSQTKGLTNASEAKTKLEGLMAKIQAAEKNRSAPDLNTREYRSIHADEAPGGMLRCIPFPGQMRGKFRKMGGRNVYEVEGYATVYNRGYEMWDKAGTYTEVMAGRAFDLSLAQQPDVAFLVNHKGVTMARTRSGSGKNPSLLLSSDSTGMGIHAFLNADRQDVKDLALA